MKNSSKIRSQFCVLDSLQNFYKSLRFSYYLFFVFLFTLQLFSTNLQAQLWGTSSTPLRGCQASRGIVTLNTLVHTGESIHWAVYKTNSAGGNDGTWTVRVYSPTGVLKATCTIAITTIDTYPTADATPNRCVDSLTATLPADTGLWTIQLIPNASSPNSDDAVGFDVKVKSSPTTILPGRTYTKYLPGLDKNTHSFSLYYLTPDGYLYRANYSGFNGAGFEIVADNLGVQTGVSSCFSNYGSMDLTAASPPNPMPDPVSSTCGGRVKIFFENPFTSITQTTAPVYNFTTSTVVQEPLFPVLVNPTLSNLLFTRTATCNASGSISFTATNYTGEAYLKFDINEDGDYIDAIDRIDTFMVVNGVNTFPFDGLDGFGNSINLSQNLNIELAFAKKGEVHFVFKDVERLTGGIEVSRLNGPGAPDYTLYWDDTKISSGPNCSNTSVLNGTAGINSTGGVHGWGGCSSGENPTMGSSTPFTGSWGNNRIIDNWTYLPISLPDATIIMPGVPGPTSSTTNITICDDELPYTWNGTSYTMAGTFVKTLVNSIGCDSTATLVLTTTVCNFCESASIPNSTSTININGGIETEWLKSTYKPIQKTTIGTISGDFVGTQWKALYDATNLYILVDVKDPNIFNDNSGGNWWEDDVVEIFIDGGNEKATSYDANDFQFAVGADGVIHAGTNGASKIGAITSSVVATPGVGYIVEIAIPWSTIGGTATDGRMIGIDVQIDDDDNGGNRDTQVSWNTNANNAFSNPSVFGQLPLSICTPPPLTLIYDNTNPTCIGLANGSIKAVASGGTIPYSYNLTGPGGPYTSLTGYFSGLNPGNYIVSVTDATLTTVSSSTITIQPFSNPLIVTNDTSVCLGSSVQLNATGGTNGYAWTPIIGLDNPSIANPIATPTVTTTYTVSSQNISNIVVNPDFEAGNVGFNSEYAFYTAQTTARQTYSISENPNNHDINFSTCPDHTTGTGKMLVVDGSDASNGANYKFWQQSIPVNIGLTYTFS